MDIYKLTIALLIIFTTVPGLKGQLLPDFSDTGVSGPWNLPVGLTFDAAGQGYLWDAWGKVYVIDTAGIVLPDPLIDLSEEVAKWLDHGLLGFALDPGFTDNGYFYLLYTVDWHYLTNYSSTNYDPAATETHRATIGRITRYTADKTFHFQRTVSGSRLVLLGATAADGFPITFDSHGLGSLVFGTDGSLLASCGDGASSVSVDTGSDPHTYYLQALEEGIIRPEDNVGAFRSQMVNNLNGKIIRIDPATGDGLSSNPFYDPAATRSARSRVWALGLRNPFRFTVEPGSGSHYLADGQPGRLIIGDVGEGYREELNIAGKGGLNFGWPVYEGFEAHPEYSIRMTPNPEAPNPLFFLDDCGQEFFNFQELLGPDQLNPVNFYNPCDPAQPVPADIITHTPTHPSIAYQNENETSQPMTETSGYTSDGQTMIIPIESDSSPIQSVHFQGDASMAGLFYHGDNFPEAYRGRYFHMDFRGWIRSFELDETGHLIKIEAFHGDCEKIVSMAVHPLDGCLYYISMKDKKIHRVCYGGNPPPVILAEADQYYGPSPLKIQFSGAMSYDLNSSVSFHWEFGDGSVSQDAAPIHTFYSPDGSPRLFPVKLTVADTFGAASTLQLNISVNNAPPEVSITSITDGARYPVNKTSLLRLEAEVSDQETVRENLDYDWQVFLHHNDHFHPSSASGQEETYAFISPLGCSQDDYWYRISLSVSDEHGLTATDERAIYPYCGASFIELSGLSAEVTEKEIRLQWSSISEDQVHAFELQRAPDFYHFSRIGSIDSRGSGSDYRFTDPAPLNGLNHYRLRVIRTDSAFDYSNLISLRFPPDPEWRVFPNPAHDFLNLEVKAAKARIISFYIYQSDGKLIGRTVLNALPGEALSHRIDISHLDGGLYYYFLQNGELTKAGPFYIKTRK